LFVVGETTYRQTREQQEIPENGCHATRDIDGKQLHMKAY
jgi:hypothetical protein